MSSKGERSKMKVGIIGSGGMAKIHGPIILKQPDVKIEALLIRI
jgi:predicted dehydrogenase